MYSYDFIHLLNFCFEISVDTDELYQYAEYIGIDPKNEQYLMHLAKEGLEAPLPPDWIPIQDENHEYSFKNQDHPLDEYYREQVIKEREQHQKLIQQDQTNSSLPPKPQGMSLLDQINAIQNNQQPINQQQNQIMQQHQNFSQQQEINNRTDDQPEINLDNLDNSDINNRVQLQQYQVPQNDIQEVLEEQNNKMQQLHQQYQNQIDELKQTQQLQMEQLQQTQKELIQNITQQFTQQFNKMSQQLENQMFETQKLKESQIQPQFDKQSDLKQKQLETTINDLQNQLNELAIDKQKLQLELSIIKKEQSQQNQYVNVDQQSDVLNQEEKLQNFVFIQFLPEEVKNKFQQKIQNLKNQKSEIQTRKNELKVQSQRLQAERERFNEILQDPTYTTSKLKQIRRKLDEKSKILNKQVEKWKLSFNEAKRIEKWLFSLQDVFLSFCEKKEQIFEILSENKEFGKFKIKNLISTEDAEKIINFVQGIEWWCQKPQELDIGDFELFQEREVPDWVDEFKRDLLE